MEQNVTFKTFNASESLSRVTQVNIFRVCLLFGLFSLFCKVPSLIKVMFEPARTQPY